MAIEFLNLTVTAPANPSDGFLGNKVLRRQRAWLVEQHQIGTDASAGFMGFSDFTGWTTVTVTTADQLAAALASSTASTKKRIYCQWNGVSVPTAEDVYGPVPAVLTPGGTEGTGYEHPTDGNMFRIEADTGYTPTIGIAADSTANSFTMRGFGWLDFRNIGFAGNVFIWRSDSAAPLRTRCAFIGCTFAAGCDGGDATASINFVYTMHVENCNFTGQLIAVRLLSNFARVWNNTFRQKNKLDDLAAIAPSTSTAFVGWVNNTWWFGNVIYECDDVLTAPEHCDLLQYGVGDEKHAESNVLYEFNICDLNIPVSQGYFTDGNGADYTIRRALAHNNLVIVRLGKAISLQDKSGVGFSSIHRNTFALAATNKVTDLNSLSGRLGDLPNGIVSGRYEITRNLLTSVVIGSGFGGNEINLDNYVYTPATWNATFIGQIVVGSGDFQRYARFDIGLTRAQAFQEYSDFFDTVWGYASSLYGMRDPLTWPTNPTAVVT